MCHVECFKYCYTTQNFERDRLRRKLKVKWMSHGCEVCCDDVKCIKLVQVEVRNTRRARVTTKLNMALT